MGTQEATLQNLLKERGLTVVSESELKMLQVLKEEKEQIHKMVQETRTVLTQATEVLVQLQETSRLQNNLLKPEAKPWWAMDKSFRDRGTDFRIRGHHHEFSEEDLKKINDFGELLQSPIPFVTSQKPSSSIENFTEAVVRTRSGMFDSLIAAYLKETGLKAEDVVLVEREGEDGFHFYYAEKKSYMPWAKNT